MIDFQRGLVLPRLPIVVHSHVCFQAVSFSLPAWDSRTNPCPPPGASCPTCPSECLGGPPPHTQVHRLGHHKEGRDITAALPPGHPLPGPTWVQGVDSTGLRRLLPIVGVKVSPAAARDEHPPGLLVVRPFSRVAPGRRLAVPTGHPWPLVPRLPAGARTTTSVTVADVCLGLCAAGRERGSTSCSPPRPHQLVPKPTAPIRCCERTPACVREGLCCCDGAWWSSSEAVIGVRPLRRRPSEGQAALASRLPAGLQPEPQGAHPVGGCLGRVCLTTARQPGQRAPAFTPGLGPANSRGHTLRTVVVSALAFPYVC